MHVKFSVLGSGHTTFHSAKTNRDYNRVRMMGFIEDCIGQRLPCTADMGFDVPLSEVPKSGDDVLLTITEMTSKNAMLEVTFSKIEPLVAPSARELKH